MTAALQELSAVEIEALIEKAGGVARVREIVSGEVDLQILTPPPAQRLVEVPSAIEFADRVQRGRYGWHHPALTEERFSITDDEVGWKEQKLFHFNRSLSSQQAITEILDAGYEPARTGDILAFGEHFPDEQRRHPVIGLGCVMMVDGSLSVPALWFDGDRRTLDLIWYDGDWHRNYRFLGVRSAVSL